MKKLTKLSEISRGGYKVVPLYLVTQLKIKKQNQVHILYWNLLYRMRRFIYSTCIEQMSFISHKNGLVYFRHFYMIEPI